MSPWGLGLGLNLSIATIDKTENDVGVYQPTCLLLVSPSWSPTITACKILARKRSCYFTDLGGLNLPMMLQCHLEGTQRMSYSSYFRNLKYLKLTFNIRFSPASSLLSLYYIISFLTLSFCRLFYDFLHDWHKDAL